MNFYLKERNMNKAMIDLKKDGADSIANFYVEKFPEQMEAYQESSIIARIGDGISAHEIMAMGQQLDQFNSYMEFSETQGTLSSLGAIPRIALDVITASVGASILPLVTSIQPIEEEHGIVWFKQIRAAQASGGYTAGQVIRDPLTLDVPGNGTLGTQRKQEVLVVTTTDLTLSYAGTTAFSPIRPYMVELYIPGVGAGKDDGGGKILGFGFSGTINYETGAYSITFAANPGADKSISVIYDTDIDALQELEKIEAGLVSKDIRAEIFALAADTGAFTNFAFSKRFGRSALDEVATDLQTEITNTLNIKAIKMLYDNAVGNTNWNQTPLTAISYAEHKLTFVDAIADAEAVLHANSGQNTVNRIIAGKTAAARLRGMPEFSPNLGAAASTVSLFGSYDNIPVIRATGVVADNEILMISNPNNYFNAPVAYSPFMPLMVTNTVQSASNPFRNTTAVGVWAGMTSLNAGLVTKLTITS